MAMHQDCFIKLLIPNRQLNILHLCLYYYHSMKIWLQNDDEYTLAHLVHTQGAKIP
jgi:hypothetical protein